MHALALKQSPAVFKRKSSWDGIRLEHFRFRAGVLPEHVHKEHLVIVPLSEACNGEIRTASGFRVRGYGRGGACVIPSGQAMSARLEGEAEHLALYLEPSLILRAASDSRAPSGVEVVERCAPSDPVISNIGMALLAELDSESSAGSRLYAESLANLLAVHLLRHYTATRPGARRFTGGLTGQKLRAVMDFIGDNYERDLTLSELAGAAGMSTFHFAREFKRATGTTPHQYLIKFRVEQAKSLLAESRLPLVEVGFRSGFSHQSHFSRLFRKLTGTTPLSYRLMFQS
ncbi:MAG TPA: AraC family transcriptional regulator [Pyrinomonadaceae bacterium]|jgi:AraC family transcriptional regulator|nr:AraC family transcriptional regulator [Pyrinomonadaceae bacterium]